MTRHEHPDDAVWIDRASGGTSTEDRSALDQHLEACSDCRQRLAQFEEAVASLRPTQPGSAPLHVLTAVLERQGAARKTTQRRAHPPRLVRLAMAAVVAALLFAGGYAQGRRGGASDHLSPASLARAPLPAPPRLVLEPATAGVGDLAFAPWARDSSSADGEDPPATRDSL